MTVAPPEKGIGAGGEENVELMDKNLNGYATEKKMHEEKHLEELQGSSEVFEVIMRHVGSFGKWQWIMFFVTSFCGVFTAFHNLAAVFLAANPDHWCHVTELDGLQTDYDIRNVSIPWIKGKDGETKYSKCSYYDRDWPSLIASGVLYGSTPPDLPLNETTAACDKWTYDHSIYESTVVEEWDLVCDNKYLMSTVQSTFMAGVLTGAVVLSELSDKYGRRTISLVSAVGMLVSSVAVTFVSHYELFITLRFFVAAFGSGLFLPNFVLLMEVVGPEARTIMGMMYQAFFSVGFMLLPAIAYFVREWRQLELCISVPTVVLLLYYWLLPESPRWLMQQGRHEEALKILEKAAKVNGGKLPEKEELELLMSKMTVSLEPEEKIAQAEDTENKTSVFEKIVNFFKSIVTLLSTKNMRRRCLIIFFAWFVVSMVYYGLTFSGGNIDASVYLMVFMSGLVEIPSYLLVCWTLKKFGRRLNLCVLFIICGAACLLILAVPKEEVWLNLTLATIGKFFNSSAFGVAYIYSAELVPTGVRNISVGTSSMCARIGSALAPFIVDLLGDVHYAVPSTVFGLLSVAAGLLALLLPETGHSRLPETVEEVEAMPR
ncbi:organic cation transporter protein-like isoform X2 [Penaeus monodon]|uniref:organic cation transporter protein-like isoform X2 n=1 Tax=Penaeus monodon TaxID=6687 RepID=UPI0018A6F5A0|nr:organic cation transporter protein-like isoform X2 [Penaeus monodon]